MQNLQVDGHDYKGGKNMALIHAYVNKIYFDVNAEGRLSKDDKDRMDRFIYENNLLDKFESFKEQNKKLTQKRLYNRFFNMIQDDFEDKKIYLSLKHYETFDILNAIDKIL